MRNSGQSCIPVTGWLPRSNHFHTHYHSLEPPAIPTDNMRAPIIATLVFAVWSLFTPQTLLGQATAEFTANQTTGCASSPLVVKFQDGSTGATSVRYFFGDANNSSSTLPNPTFIYSTPGCYDVTMVAFSASGNDTIVKPCFVEIFPLPEPDFQVSISDGCAPLEVTITDLSVANADSIVNYTWVVSDGSNSSDPNPTFTFNTPDTLDFVLTITNSNGCTRALPFSDVVIVREPVELDFEVDITSACGPPLQVNYTNLSQTNGAQSPQFIWEFPGGNISGGGGSTFTGPNPPPVNYNSDGNFDARLILTSANACEDTLELVDIIGIGGVTASFTSDFQTICLGDTINFSSSTTGGVTDYGWDFGETPGVDATTPDAFYVYSQPGTYSVSLFANNVDCGDTLTEVNYITVLPRPTADFSIDHDEDCQPGIPFVFTDNSTGAVSWDWDFGDGTTSTQQNPSHTYNIFGEFTVCLTITNAQGCTNTFCDTILIEKPDLTLLVSEDEGCAPLTIDVAGINNNPIDPVTSWTWSFPGGTPATATGANATVTYGIGIHTLQVIAITASGCSDTLVRGNIRVGEPPLNGFTVDKDTVCIMEDITFTATNTDPDWNYYWDFMYMSPGQFIQQDSAPITVYPDTGTFSVGLVIESQGCRDTLIQEDLVFVSPPRAQFTLSDTLVCGLPDTISITDESLGPADIIEWYLNGALYDNTSTPPDLVITNPNSYILTQIVTNSLSGCTDTFEMVILAGNPQADFVVPGGVTQGCKPFDVNFLNLSSDYATVNWRYGNGSTGGTNDGLTTYQDTGLYSIRLRVRDQFGCIAEETKTDYIEVIGPYAEFSGDPLEGCPGTTIQFSDSSTSYGTTVNSWSWDFGDPASGGNNTSTQQNPSHLFTTAGMYDITLAVEDDQGCRDTLTKPDFVNITFPELSFTALDSSTCAGADVNFINNSVGADLTYQWEFGDGFGTDTVENPVYSYDSTGFYTVTLIGTDRNGCTDTLVRPQAIFIEEFIADFTADSVQNGVLTSFCPPLNAIFRNQTVGNDSAWLWDFGTGIGGSFLENPGYTYFEPGDFDVRLIAIHEDGCRDTLVKDSFVVIGGPRGDFSLDPDDACLGDTVCFTAFTSFAVSAIVDFRDGATVDNITLNGGQDTILLCHLYQNAQQYKPAILLEDAAGCAVLFEDKDSTMIHSLPVAAFEPGDTVGCSPLTLNFTDLSLGGDTAVSIWQWDFAAGATDTVQNPSFTFTGDSTYDVQLLVSDIYGCSDSFSTQVQTLEGAIPNFAATDTTGCAPEVIQFNDLSTGDPVINWTWIFGDGDTLSTDDPNPTHLYNENGTYTVTLIVDDAVGCSDTIVKEQYINLAQPTAVVYSASDRICSPTTAIFYGDSSTSARGIVTYDWCLTDLGTGDITCFTTSAPEDSIEFTFPDPGQFEIDLVVTDQEGCTDTASTFNLTVDEQITPAPINLLRVSVESASSSILDWERYTGVDFLSYRIIRIENGQPVEVAVIRDQDSISYIDSDPALDFESQPYCYKVLVENDCQVLSFIDETLEHCTIELTATPAVDAIDLSWTPYVGFTPVSYNVYRAQDYDLNSLQIIAQLPGNTTEYTDRETFCRDSVSYRIEALGTETWQVSYSDVASEAPIHLPPSTSIGIEVATVEQDSFVVINWEEYTGYAPEQYILEKSLDGTVWTVIDSFDLLTRTFSDFEVLVDESSYFYRAFALDQCGDMTLEGRLGKTILLDIDMGSGERPELSWSHYEEWEFGVANYEIEVFDDLTGQWLRVGPVPGNDQTFRDETTELSQPTFCYRIVGVELAGGDALAVSNVACVTFGPKLFIPNAFTPNNDGNNDVFTVGLNNIEQGEISIYSQWGELIYQSSSLQDGWDGQVRDTGREAPEGVYVYKIVIDGFEETQLVRSGTITLVR